MEDMNTFPWHIANLLSAGYLGPYIDNQNVRYCPLLPCNLSANRLALSGLALDGQLAVTANFNLLAFGLLAVSSRGKHSSNILSCSELTPGISDWLTVWDLARARDAGRCCDRAGYGNIMPGAITVGPGLARSPRLGPG